jgi:chaperonin GroEL (HSP60 family)
VEEGIVAGGGTAYVVAGKAVEKLVCETTAGDDQDRRWPSSPRR